MSVLVTGSAGHLGEALMRTFRARGQAAVGIDLLASPFTDRGRTDQAPPPSAYRAPDGDGGAAPAAEEPTSESRNGSAK